MKVCPGRINVCPLSLVILLFLSVGAHAQKMVLDKKWHHVRIGTDREWMDFPLHAEDSQLVIHFNLKDAAAYQTISLRQKDIGQEWEGELNGIKLGTLPLDEKDMISYFAIPSGILKSGS